MIIKEHFHTNQSFRGRMAGEERFELLSVSQGSYKGYLACSVCTCYASLIPPNQLCVEACDMAIKLGCTKWKSTFGGSKLLENAESNTLLSPVQVIENISFLKRHLKIDVEYDGIISEERRFNSTHLESAMDLIDLHVLLHNLEMKCRENDLDHLNAAFCQGGGCFLIRIQIDTCGNTWFTIVDSHSSEFARGWNISSANIPRNQIMPGFIYTTSNEDLMVEFIRAKSGGGIATQLLNDLDRNISTGSAGDNWLSDQQLTKYQFTCYVLAQTW